MGMKPSQSEMIKVTMHCSAFPTNQNLWVQYNTYTFWYLSWWRKEKASRKARLIFLNFMGSIQPHTCMLCVWIEFLEFTTSIWDNISMQHSLIVGREVLILTLYILLTPQGCISWHIPKDGLMIREWPYTASNQDALGCTPPPTSRFPSALEMSLGTRDLSVIRDAQPNTSFLSAVYVYNITHTHAHTHNPSSSTGEHAMGCQLTGSASQLASP